MGYLQDLEGRALDNGDFRRVVYTARYSQLVLMSLAPEEDLGEEVHPRDQFFSVKAGQGVAVLDGLRTRVEAGFAVIVPAGVPHNIINTGTEPLKLYTLYSPPNHREGVVHRTRADADAARDDELELRLDQLVSAPIRVA